MSTKDDRPAALILQCLPMLNLTLDQVRDTGAEWPTPAFDRVDRALQEHNARLQALLSLVPSRVQALFFSSPQLKDEDKNLVERASASRARLARREGEADLEFEISGPNPDESTTPEQLKNRVDTIEPIQSATSAM
ncbi:hypothetical protein R3P38DRAFT_3185340 [Favolaschia claudopus]|uniref:Uncharacterized protein n=1 Tax=Favolaschia claudopus TaxID=2862362 RepID=A0AAW0C5L1_9AGAR